MNTSFECYINCFLHPKSSQEVTIEGEDVLYFPTKENRHRKYLLSLEESLGISWLFAVCQGFYAIITIFLGLEFFKVSEQSLQSISQASLSVKIFLIVLETALFPVGFWFYSKFWSKLIYLSCQAFNIRGDEKECEDIVVKSMTGHILLLFPFFGKLFSSFAVIIYLFTGLRVHLRFSLFQAVCVLVLPVAVILLSLAFMAFSLILVLSGI